MTDKIELKRQAIERVIFVIKGISPLLTNRAHKDVITNIAEPQQGRVSEREFRDPQNEYRLSQYRFEDGRHGFPAIGFKIAMVNACRQFDKITMTNARVAFRVHGETTEIEGKYVQLIDIHGEPNFQEDIVRPQRNVTTIAYRASYWPWWATLDITFNSSMFSLEQMGFLLQAAGYNGVGAWRPEKNGDYGMFDLMPKEEWKDVGYKGI